MKIFQIGLILIAVISFVYTLLGFLGKDIILDDIYLKAPKEKQDQMDKKAFCLQGTLIFLFIFIATLCGLLRTLTNMPWFTYLAYAFAAIGLVYTVVSHYMLKMKYK